MSIRLNVCAMSSHTLLLLYCSFCDTRSLAVVNRLSVRGKGMLEELLLIIL